MNGRMVRTIAAIVAPFVLGAGLIVAVILVFRPQTAPELPLEAHSGEEGVVASVFIPSVVWDAEREVIEASAIVTAFVEPEGVCTLRAERDGVVLEAQSGAQPDASTMTCGRMVVGGGIARGTWVVTVSYEGAGLQARSDPISVEVE